MKSYETEARGRWGNTDAYREHEQKTKNPSASPIRNKFGLSLFGRIVHT